MTVVRRLARPLLAAMFIDGGLDALRHPSTKVAKAAPLVHKIAGPLHLPDDPELLVRANGVAMVTAGGLFATGRLPRLSALVLAGSIVPTTVAGHAFWKESDPVQRRNQRVHLLKNLGLLGGLLLAAADTEGRPSIRYRTTHAVDRSQRAVKRAAKAAKREAKIAARSAAMARKLPG